MRAATRVLIAVSVVGALAITAAAQAPKGLEGTWKLNPAKSKFDPGPAPRDATLTYALSGDSLKVVAHQTPAEGAAQHWEMTVKYDGKDYPVTGNPIADTVTVKKIGDLKSESTFKKAGKVTAVTTRTLSADGKTLTIESKGTDEKGRPSHNIQIFER